MPRHVLTPPFADPTFTLDVGGIAGFFGGEEAFAAMISVHLIPARRWMGWYNSPGSYIVAKKYGTLPKSIFWDGLFPGPSLEPTQLLEMDSGTGMRYTGVFSGTQLPSTGHLSYLLSTYCKQTLQSSLPPHLLGGKNEVPVSVPKADQPKHRNIAVTVARFPDFEEWEPHGAYPTIPYGMFASFTWLATVFIILTMAFSVASAVLSALYDDWYSFAMILFGVITNGLTCLVLGSGKLQVDFPKPSDKSPPGDGILFDSENIILLQGGERVISSVLHSRFRLAYENDPNYHRIGLVSVLLLCQFIAQLFLIPQGKLIGQIFFLASLAMSWICNGYLASFDSEELQTDLLFKIVREPMLYKFPVTKWSMGVAFALFYFKPKDPRGILNELMPNNTLAWDLWKECICCSIAHSCKPSDLISESDTWFDGLKHPEKRAASDRMKAAFNALPTAEDKSFVREFLHQADDAYNSVPELQGNARFVKAGYGNDESKKRGYQKASYLP